MIEGSAFLIRHGGDGIMYITVTLPGGRRLYCGLSYEEGAAMRVVMRLGVNLIPEIGEIIRATSPATWHELMGSIRHPLITIELDGNTCQGWLAGGGEFQMGALA